MTFLGLEKPVELGRQQIFDPTVANMVLNANRDYITAVYNDYKQSLQDMKEFNKTYGDFMSPFAKDMERYGEMVGSIRNAINEAYSKGVDLTRSPEGRMIIGQLVNSIDPREFNTMRANAKIGYEYLDA